MPKTALKLTAFNAADLVAAFEKQKKTDHFDQQTNATSRANLQLFKRRHGMN